MSEPALTTLPFMRPTHCRRYEGRVAIVTGAAQGLGLVIARRLAEEGADMVACDVQEERLAQRARELQDGKKSKTDTTRLPVLYYSWFKPVDWAMTFGIPSLSHRLPQLPPTRAYEVQC